MISEITFNEKILFVCKQYMQNRKFESDFVFLETFITELNELIPSTKKLYYEKNLWKK